MTCVVVKSIAGDTVLTTGSLQEPVSGATIRHWVAEIVGAAPDSRLKLLQGESILQYNNLVQGGTTDAPIVLTLVILPALQISVKSKPLILPMSDDDDDDAVVVKVKHVRTGDYVPLPIQYFVETDGQAHLGMRALDLAPVIGANATIISREASMNAVFEGEEELKSFAVEPGALWRVIFKDPSGGLVVTAGKDLTSPKLPQKLEKDSLLQEVESQGNRLHYKMVKGRGPRTGWIDLTTRIITEGRIEKTCDRVGHAHSEVATQIADPLRAVIALEKAHSAFRLGMREWQEENPTIELMQAIMMELERALASPPQNQAKYEALIWARRHLPV